MARSLSLAAYMALARRAPKSQIIFPQERPSGDLVWAHAPSLRRAEALIQFFNLLENQRPGTGFLLTTETDMPRPDRMPGRILWQQIPDDLVPNIYAFLRHWRPDICLWSGGHLHPAAIELTARANIPLFLVDAEADALEDVRFRWLPDMSRGILRRFSAIHAIDTKAAQRLSRIGIAENHITVSGALQSGRAALPCNEALREEMTTALNRRPTWLAAMAQVDEVGMLSQAHKSLIRMAHRQLLIIVPDDETQGPVVTDKLRQWGWTVALWSEGDMPDEDTQILVADTRGELGLWYRLSPVTLMCSSLVPGFGGCDPYEPAALGSAILYGPNVGRHLETYGRFSDAGAAQMVRNADALANALSRLSAPDQAAAMAHAGWEVSSAGAEITDALIEQVQDVLDTADKRA